MSEEKNKTEQLFGDPTALADDQPQRGFGKICVACRHQNPIWKGEMPHRREDLITGCLLTRFRSGSPYLDGPMDLDPSWRTAVGMLADVAGPTIRRYRDSSEHCTHLNR